MCSKYSSSVALPSKDKNSDDCSTDHTRDIVEQFIQENGLSGKRQFYCNHENKGYPDNFYDCMSLCRGDYVFLADQDDIWDRHKLERMTDVMKKNDGTKVLSCKFGLINEEGSKIYTVMKPTRTKRTETTGCLTVRVLCRQRKGIRL